MDTKSKNSHKRGIIITVILLAFCSVMMLSQYDSIRGTVETAPTAYEASFADTLMESSIGQDLAEGNYLVYNQYSHDTDPADVLSDYGQRNFELTAKYLDIGLYDAEGKPLTEARAQTEDVGEADAAETADITDAAEDRTDTAETMSTTDRRLQEPDEESAGYAFRAEYTFSADGRNTSWKISSLCTLSRPKMKNIFPASRRPRM